MSLTDDELAYDLRVIEAATPGPWSIGYVDDDLSMNARVIRRDEGSGELDDHENNIAIVLLQSPRYADVSDKKWDENAEFIVRARYRWPELIAEIRELRERLESLQRENSDLRRSI